ncbi:MAG TPA: hypothetical protein VIG79_15025, partial [Lapillicoccus sp.]
MSAHHEAVGAGRVPARLVAALVALALAVGLVPWLFPSDSSSSRPEATSSSAAAPAVPAVLAGPVRDRAAELVDGMYQISQILGELSSLQAQVQAVKQSASQQLRQMVKTGSRSTTAAPTKTVTVKSGSSSAAPVLSVVPVPPAGSADNPAPPGAGTETSTGSTMQCVRSADGNSVTCTSGRSSNTPAPTPTPNPSSTPTPSQTPSPAPSPAPNSSATQQTTSGAGEAETQQLNARSAPDTPVEGADLGSGQLASAVATAKAEWKA